MPVRHVAIAAAMYGVLLGGCRTQYFIEPHVAPQAYQTVDRTGFASDHVAVAVRPIEKKTPPGDVVSPPKYVLLSAIQVEEQPPVGAWRISTRNRRSFLAGGGILLSIGLISIVGGVIGFARDASTPCSSDGCHFGVYAIALPALIGGLAEAVPGGLLIGLGYPDVEVERGLRDRIYIDEPPPPIDSHGIVSGLPRVRLRF